MPKINWLNCNLRSKGGPGVSHRHSEDMGISASARCTISIIIISVCDTRKAQNLEEKKRQYVVNLQIHDLPVLKTMKVRQASEN